MELPFEPPENWYEPKGSDGAYKLKVQNPGPDFKHVLTPDVVDVTDILTRGVKILECGVFGPVHDLVRKLADNRGKKSPDR